MTDVEPVEATEETAVKEAPPFEWVDDLPDAAPRAAGAGRGVDPHWAEVASMLKAHEGAWALVSTHEKAATAANHAARIRSGKSKAFEPAHYFEAKGRPTPEGKHGVYARYTGEPAPVAENTDGVAPTAQEVEQA